MSEIDGVKLTAGSKILVTSAKPRWWRFRARKNYKRSGAGKQNGIYTVTSTSWERKDPPA